MSSDRSISVLSSVQWDVRTAIAWGVLLAAVATIAGAWGFQLIGGYIPCKLCYGQRLPYYVGVPIASLAVIAVMMGRDTAARILLLAVAGIFIWSAYRGIFHAGVEWEWWQGPTDCGAVGGVTERNAGDLLGQLAQIRVVSCTVASWRFPGDWGLSFAGWNGVISIVIAGAALIGAARARRRTA